MIIGHQAQGGESVGGEGSLEGQSLIFDVSSADFEEKVLKASMQVPVIADFWASWCGPCKQLTPLLEKAVREAGGQVLLAKINVDDSQDLAQAMRIQSLPTVYAFFGGRPVDAFQGLLPESQIKAFIQKIVQAVKNAQPDALDIPETLKIAAQALAAGDLGSAQNLYAQVLQQDEKDAEAYAGMVRTLIQAGQLQQARSFIDGAPEEIQKKPAFAEAKTALELAETIPEKSSRDLEVRVHADPGDLQARYDLALAQFTEGARAEAIDNLLIIIEREREWHDEAARKQLLKFFEAMGQSDPLTLQARKKLSSLLFS